MGWNDAGNNEAYMAGKLVSTNNGASLYYAMGARNHALHEKTQLAEDLIRQTGRVADGSFGRDLVEAARTARNET